MIKFFKNLLGASSKRNIAELMKKGATIVDVRTEREFKSGHVNGSVNIPLDSLSKSISKLKKDKPVITCCASGMRSSAAKGILLNHGFAEVYNGGSWISVQQKLE